MAQRQSYQKGSLHFHRGCWTVRYRYLNTETNMLEMRRSKLEGCTDPRNKKAARSAADEFMIGINQHNNNPRRAVAKLTLEAFINTHWATYLDKRQVAGATREAYSTITNRYLLPGLGAKSLREITPTMLTEFFNSLPDTLSPRYERNIYSLLRRMFEVARQYELIDSIPLRTLFHKPKEAAQEKPILTVEQMRLLIAAIPVEHRLMLIVLSLTGMRIGEVMGLRWSDFNADRRELKITHSVWRRKLKEPKTENSRRSFVLPPAIVEALIDHRKASRFNSDDDLIFPSTDGRPYRQNTLRYSVLYPAMDSIGIRRGKYTHGYHIIRHSVGSLLHKRTGDVKLVQELLGHARIETTSNIYIHVDEDSRSSASELLFLELAEVVSETVS